MKCERCGNTMTIHTLSWFNKQTICLECDAEELNHPQIGEAKRIEHEHCKKGNYNFRGIGLPVDLRIKYGCSDF